MVDVLAVEAVRVERLRHLQGKGGGHVCSSLVRYDCSLKGFLKRELYQAVQFSL